MHRDRERAAVMYLYVGVNDTGFGAYLRDRQDEVVATTSQLFPSC